MSTKIFRSWYVSVPKVRFAESRGAVAVILYNDPSDVAPLGPSETYPSSVYAPPGATHLGSLKMQGDLLTPGYPAVGKTNYYDISSSKSLPVTTFCT